MKNKAKKPFWKRWWIWILVIFFLFCSCGNNSENEIEVEPIVIEETITSTIEKITIEEVAETIPVVESEVTETIESILEAESEKIVIYVYTTPSGTKYHRVNCRHIKNSDLTEWDIEQVPSSYESCGTCSP